MSPSDAGKHVDGAENADCEIQQVEAYGIPKQHQRQHYDKPLTSARASSRTFYPTRRYAKSFSKELH